MRDSYPPGASAAADAPAYSFPTPSPVAFPTPAEARAKYAANNAAAVNAIVERLREEVTRDVDRTTTVMIVVPTPLRDAVRAIVEPAGWTLEFGSDVRGGAWITIAPKVSP